LAVIKTSIARMWATDSTGMAKALRVAQDAALVNGCVFRPQNLPTEGGGSAWVRGYPRLQVNVAASPSSS
jgi:hypothetical protein